MNILTLTTAELADWLGNWLASTNSNQIQSNGCFYALPGQDPFTHMTPHAAIAAMYWAVEFEGQLKLRRAVQSLATRSPLRLSIENFQVLLDTAGAIADADSLIRLTQATRGRCDIGSRATSVYQKIIGTAQGFGDNTTAWDIARELVELPQCPMLLVFDIFDLGLTDTREHWHDWFKKLEEKMYHIYTRKRAKAIKKRLSFSANRMKDKLSRTRIEAGIKNLMNTNELRPLDAEEGTEIQNIRRLLEIELIKIQAVDFKPSPKHLEKTTPTSSQSTYPAIKALSQMVD